MTSTIDIVFDGPPSHDAPRLIEVERDGRSITFGEWVLRPDGYWVLRVPDSEAMQARLERLKTLALDWYHGEDCDGYGSDEEAEWPECNCGVGDVLRETMPAGVEVYIDRTAERYGLSRIVESKPKERA